MAHRLSLPPFTHCTAMNSSWTSRDVADLSSTPMPGITFLHSNHPFTSSHELIQFPLSNGDTNTAHNDLAAATMPEALRSSRTPEPWMYANLPIEYNIENQGHTQQRLYALGNRSGCHVYPSTTSSPQQQGLLTPPELRSMDISDDEESASYSEEQQQTNQGLGRLSYTTSLYRPMDPQSPMRRPCQPHAVFDSASPVPQPQSTNVTTSIDTLAGTPQHIDSQQYMLMMHEATNKVLSLASSQGEPMHSINRNNRHYMPDTTARHPSYHLQLPRPPIAKRVHSAESIMSSTPSSPLIFATLPPSNPPPPSTPFHSDYFTSLPPPNNGSGSIRHLSSSDMSNVNAILDTDLTVTPRPPSSPHNGQEYYHHSYPLQSSQHQPPPPLSGQIQIPMSREALLMKQVGSTSMSLPSAFSTSFSSNCSYSSASPASSLPASPMLGLVAGPFPSRASARSVPDPSCFLHKNKNKNKHGRRSTPTPSSSNVSIAAFSFNPTCPSSSSSATTTTTSSTPLLSSSSSQSMMKKNQARFVCQIQDCQRTFSRPFNLKSHGLTHETERPHGCGLCSKTFARIHDRDRHRKGHLVEKAHSCVVCLGRFARQDAVTRHLKLSNEQNPCSLILKSRGLSFRDAAAGRITREMVGRDEGEIRRRLEQLEDLSRRAKATRNLKMGMMALNVGMGMGMDRDMNVNMNMNLDLDLDFEEDEGAALELGSDLGPPPQLYDSQGW